MRLKCAQPNPLSKDDLRIIVELSADSSVSRPEIAAKIGCAKSTVFKWQKRLGVL